MLTSSCIRQLADGCEAVVRSLEHWAKPKGAAKWVYMGRVFAAALIPLALINPTADSEAVWKFHSVAFVLPARQ